MKIKEEEIKSFISNTIDNGIENKELLKFSIKLKESDRESKEVFHQALEDKFALICKEIERLDSPVLEDMVS